MTYYIGAFFAGLGAVIIALSILYGVIAAAEPATKFLNRKIGTSLVVVDLLFGVPIIVLLCTAIGTSILDHFKP